MRYPLLFVPLFFLYACTADAPEPPADAATGAFVRCPCRRMSLRKPFGAGSQRGASRVATATKMAGSEVVAA